MLVYLIGILPMTNFKQVSRFSAMCGASIPNWLADLFDGLEGDKGTLSLVAASVATEQCRALLANGIDRFPPNSTPLRSAGVILFGVTTSSFSLRQVLLFF